MKKVECVREVLRGVSRVRMSLLLLMTIVISFLEGLSVGIVVPVLSFVTASGNEEKLPLVGDLLTRNDILDRTGGIMAVLALLVVCFIVKNTLAILNVYLQGRFVQQESARLSTTVLKYSLTAPLTRQNQKDSSDVLVLMNDWIPGVFNHYIMSAITLCTEALAAIFVLAVVITVEPKITLIVATIFILGYGAFYLVVSGSIFRMGQESSEVEKDITRFTRESLVGQKEIRVAGLQETFVNRYSVRRLILARLITINLLLHSLPRAITETIVILVLVVICGISVTSDVSLESMIGVLGMLAVAALRLLPVGNKIVRNLQMMRFNEDKLKRVGGELRELRQLTHSKRSKAFLIFDHEFVLEKVSLVYPSRERYALQDISLTIKRGERVALVGPSGAGKTTLGDILLGLIPPSSGKILLDGRALDLESHGWDGRAGYVPQKTMLLNDTLKRNITFNFDSASDDKERLSGAIAKAQLSNVVKGLPNGLETLVGEDGLSLSGGQRQRVAIARAFYSKPDLIVFDEATSALDMQTEAEVQKAIEALSGEVTTVTIAHRLSTIAKCDRVFFLQEGRLVAEGTLDTLMETCRPFRDMATALEK